MKIKGVCNKIVFLTKESAEMERVRLNKERSEQRVKHYKLPICNLLKHLTAVYLCKNCSFWHLTSQKQRISKKKRQT